MASSTRTPMAETTRVSPAMVKKISKKGLGEVPSPLGVCWNDRPVLEDYFAISGEDQKEEAHDRPAEVVRPHGGRVARGLHLGASTSDTSRLTTRTSTWRRLAACLVWRESEVFTPLEVMACTEAMSQPPAPGYPTNSNRDNAARRSS